MGYTRYTSLVLAVIAAGVTLSATTFGQEAASEVEPPPALKQGDKVVALRAAPLQIEAKTVATARAGDTLVVEKVRGSWLWVRSGETRGWIASRNVLGARLLDWYKRLPNLCSVPDKASRGTRAKIRGVMVDVLAAGPGVLTLENVTVALPHGKTLADMTVDGVSLDKVTGEGLDGPVVDGVLTIGSSKLSIGGATKFTGSGLTQLSGTTLTLEGIAGENRLPIPDGLLYDSVNVQLGTAVGGQSPLLVKFPGIRLLPPPPGTFYGSVRQGDYVFIDTEARKVYVNGNLRRPRG